MKRLISLIVCLVLVASLFCSCSFVTSFMRKSDTESAKSSQSESSSLSDTSSGQTLSSESSEQTHIHTFKKTVIAPTCVDKGYTEHLCKCGYYFYDMFTEPVGSHSFEKGLCTLCGELDYPELINLISTETIKANVTVSVAYYTKSFMHTTSIGGSNGSGVIIKTVDDASGAYEYYALTNSHVVYNSELELKSSITEYTVTDYRGEVYTAQVVARKAEYDLAIVKFTSSEKYTVLALEDGNSKEGELVISLGQPEGQSNTITLGNALGYEKVSVSNTSASESNVNFEVLKHDAYINSGSSGGALLDAQLNIIGINFAGLIDEETGESFGSYAIPVENVYDFFDIVGFEYADSEAGEDAA